MPVLAPVVSLYEGLFLVSQNAATDLNAAIEHVKQILTRAEAEIVGVARFDERKLAFPVKGQRRGTYIISLFRCNRANLAHIERDSNLSEQILRSLVTRADHVGDVELEMFKNGVFDWAPKKPEPADDKLVIPGVPELSGEML